MLKKEEHLNITGCGKDEAYRILQSNYKTDIYFCLFWDIVFIIFALGGIFLTGNNEWFWLFGGMWAIVRKLETFIDNSNRNWTMHLIDWIEEGKIYGKEEEIDEDR